MEQRNRTLAFAKALNFRFERKMQQFLNLWVKKHADETLLQFDQSIETYLANNALRDLFLHTQHPLQELLSLPFVVQHLGRPMAHVYFDPVNGDPLLAPSEQRIYNLARRLETEGMHVPFRAVQSNKQTENGDTSAVVSYPANSEEIRYNSGNHFASRPANNNVFEANSKQCTAKANGQLHVFFKRGYLEDRLAEVKEMTAKMRDEGETSLQFFVIYSRHSVTEGHFGVSLVIMDPATPYFPRRVMVCDTLLKELPQHPRWWHHFVAEFSNVFGDAIAEIIEDLSHPLQKVNIKGDEPYRHDWDCPYYAASMANALTDLVAQQPELLLNGSATAIYDAMKSHMPDYYHANHTLKDRKGIRKVNQFKRWESGRELILKLGLQSAAVTN